MRRTLSILMMLALSLAATAASALTIQRSLSIVLDASQVTALVDSVGNTGSRWAIPDSGQLSDVSLNVGDTLVLDIEFVGQLTIEDFGNGFFDNGFGATGFEQLALTVGILSQNPAVQPSYDRFSYLVDENGAAVTSPLGTNSASSLVLVGGELSDLTSSALTFSGIHAEWEITSLVTGTGPFSLTGVGARITAESITVVPEPAGGLLLALAAILTTAGKRVRSR